jgi:tetratricopeptide (TPR) repeat protein
MAMLGGDYAAAVTAFRAGVAAAPDEAPMFVALIAALERAGERDEAVRHAGRAQERWPRDPDIWRTSGDVYRAGGQGRRAVAAYEHAIDLDPDLEAAYLGLARAWVGLRRPDLAEEVYRRLVAHDAGSTQGHYLLGQRLIDRDRPEEAAEHLRRALEIDPDHTRARIALARALRAAGRAADSVATLRQAFDRSGGHPSVGERLFYQLLEVDDLDGAVELLSVLDRDDLEPETRVRFGYLYLHIGRGAEALAVAERVLARHPRSDEARILAARAQVEVGRRDRALELLLAIDGPGFAAARAYASELLARGGDPSAALEALAPALERHPDQARLIVSQALALELGGQRDRGREVLRAGLRTHPGHPDLVYAWASLEDRAGRPARAIAIMERLLELDPDNVTALNFIGYLLAERGTQLDRAQRLLERALELAPGDGYILDSYGWLLARQGRWDQAEETLRRAARLAPAEPEILYHLAEVRAARGDPAGALGLLERARSHAPPEPLAARIERRIETLRAEE